MWDLCLRMQGQVRADNGRLLGWDMTAGLALAEALGLSTFLAAEVLPEVEAIACRQINAMKDADDE